jgi:hypothetical protein
LAQPIIVNAKVVGNLMHHRALDLAPYFLIVSAGNLLYWSLIEGDRVRWNKVVSMRPFSEGNAMV